MSEFKSKSPSNGDNKSSINSGGPNKTDYVKTLGGYPSEKSTKEIDRQNSPAGRKKAPGSVRV